jgi:hypothetical protein
LLTFGQSFDFVDLFSKKCKRYHRAKLGYDKHKSQIVRGCSFYLNL